MEQMFSCRGFTAPGEEEEEEDKEREEEEERTRRDQCGGQTSCGEEGGEMAVVHMRRFREEGRRGQEEVKTGGALVGWTD